MVVPLGSENNNAVGPVEKEVVDWGLERIVEEDKLE